MSPTQLWLRTTALVALAAPAGVTVSAQQDRTQFQSEMRKLWEDQVVLTRRYFVSVTRGLPDKDSSAKRLLENQDEIGAAMKPFYGAATSGRLTALLKEHITIATLIAETTMQGDNTMRPTLTARWTANADSVALLLAGVNRTHWELDELKSMLQYHLEHSTTQLVARVQKDDAGEQTAYDKVHDHILKFADYLSNGIISQFPDRFGR